MTLTENPELTVVGGILLFSQAPGKKLFVLRVSEAEFRAVSAVCTHQGCTVEWTGESFECPCHASRFSAEGAVTRGPAFTALRTFPTMLEGDQLTIML